MSGYRDNLDDVFEAIIGELDYQDRKWPRPDENEEVSVEGAIVLLKQYVDFAVHDWTTERGNLAALHQIRKVAAIAVRAMANHGSLRRTS